MNMLNKQSITAVDSSDFMAFNAMSLEEFTTKLADVFEHSPWVAERVSHLRPFTDVNQLHRAMVSAVKQASAMEQLELLRAHPMLAGKEAQQGELTAASEQEQAFVGLKALSSDEMKCITGLNAAYLDRHGFPFIVCVRMHTKQSLILEFGRRLGNSSEVEVREALRQIDAIALLRLKAMFSS